MVIKRMAKVLDEQSDQNSEPPAIVDKKSRIRPTNEFKLISCEQYGLGNKESEPYKVELNVEALAVVDVHAHCVQTEVIGLLGGTYCPHTRQLKVLIAEPCRSLSEGTTDLQCEMCPVSQFEAMEKINATGNNVIGWYHSHPTFVPNPSLRDIETQSKFQQMFCKENDQPFLALILSPYSGSINPAQKKTLPSKYQCFIVSDDKHQQADYLIPYELATRVVRKDKLRMNLMSRVQHLCQYLGEQKTSHCMIDRIRGRDLLLIDKMSASLVSHLIGAGLSQKEAASHIEIVKFIVHKHLSTTKKKST
jgi:protein MYSM1